VDYLFTDEISSPRHLENLYAEKLIYMPNHFFSKGHAMQAEVVPPALEYAPKETPYRLGTGSPQENRCLAPANVGPAEPSFVFCNFNKLLKNNPDTLRSWIHILRDTPDAILCLLENPKESVDYVRKFVHEAAGTSDGDWDSFVPGDGDELNERIHFLPWERNPFDHQQRNRDFCNLMLDSFPYNGHTVAQDALYAGVPIVTRSDGLDMASRVSTSANVVLGMEHLNAQEGIRDYQAIAVRMATNAAAYEQTRTQLLATALQRNPMHPYWDVPRYVKNFETGLTIAWERFLKGLPLDHIFIEESAEAAKGTYDSEIAQHPPDGARDEL
jgi:protein O-GlcNAc transferase